MANNKSIKWLVSKEVIEYSEECTGPVSSLLERVEKETFENEKIKLPEMLTGRAEGKLLQMLVKISKAKRAVDIGTFTGYSALTIAEALPKNGKVITCEINEYYARIAQEYFNKSPHGKKIQLKLGLAIETLRKIPAKSADFVFIDADKSSYPLYYEESLRILKKAGLIVADNVLRLYRVQSMKDETNKAIALFNQKVKNDKRVEKVMLTLRDGVYLIRKL